MNARNFVLDVWADLKAERLWPVAVALLLVILAIPFVLIKPAEEVAPAPTTSAGAVAEPNGPREVLAALNSKPLVRVSSLDRFRSKNPFKPLATLRDLEDQAGVEAETTDPSGAEGASVADGVESGGSGGSGGSSGGGTTGGGTTGGSTGGNSTGGDNGKAKDDAKPAKKYTYVLNLTFDDGTRTRQIKGFNRLGILPNDSSPLLVFLGMDARATNAVFLVDSSLKPTGEGTCKPKPSDCGFLYLEAGEEEVFTDPKGRTYTLRIDRVRKVEVKTEKADTAKTAGRRPTATTADGEPDSAGRRFELAPIFDFEVSGG